MLNKVLNIIKNANKILFEGRSSFIIFSLFLILLFSRSFPSIKDIYFFIPLFFIAYIIFGINSIRESVEIKWAVRLIVLFSIFAVISSFWSPYPIFTLKRAIYFTLVVFGSLIIGFNLTKKGYHPIINSFVLLNFIIILLSIYSLLSNTPANSWSGGHGLGFMGFTHHQNKFGQYIFLTSAPLVLLVHGSKTKRIVKYLISMLLIANVFFIALSVSRGAILTLFLTGFIFYFLNFSFLKAILFSVLFVMIISATIIVTTHYFNKEQITLIKNENSFGERRYQTIIDSWESAINGSLFGLGYGISDERFKNPLLGYYDITSEGKIYRREKTVSLLALIEEVGIVGLFLFLSIILYPIKLLWDRRKELRTSIQNPKSSFLVFTFAFLISLNIYAQIESWWIGIGSAVMPVYFIFTGAVIKGSEIIKVNSNG